jgi:hypothetical protein
MSNWKKVDIYFLEDTTINQALQVGEKEAIFALPAKQNASINIIVRKN